METVTPLVFLVAVGLGYILHTAFTTRVHQRALARSTHSIYVSLAFLITYLVLPAVSTTIFGAFNQVNVDPDNLMPGTPTYMASDYRCVCWRGATALVGPLLTLPIALIIALATSASLATRRSTGLSSSGPSSSSSCTWWVCR